jgi:tetratricopeptide (TPR) repeat protein
LSALDAIKSDNEKNVQTAFQNLCKKLPDSYFPYIVAGLILEPPEDKPYFEKAIEMAPESNFVRAAYGDKLLSQNKPKKAAEQFEIVTEWNPNHIFAYHGQLASLVMADPNAAELLGKKLTERWPQNAGFCFEYSRALRAKNKRKEELPIIQNAVKLSKTVSYQYQRYLADSLTANKRYEEAERAYKKLLKTHECEHCWRAYISLLLKMGPDKAQQVKKAFAKAKSLKQNPNTISEKYCDYEHAPEKMLSDPNMVEK